MEAYTCADEFAGCTSPVILFSSHEQKIASTEANEEKKYGAADGRARRASNALWPVHHLWIQGPWAAGRGGFAGLRQRGREKRPLCTRLLSVADGGRAHFLSGWLPPPALIFAVKKRSK